MMIKTILKIKRLQGDARAASRGPKALAMRLAQRAAHRLVHKVFR